jgi:Flp pilus assembly protein TadD
MGITLPAVLLVWEVAAHHGKGGVVQRAIATLRDQPVFWGILWAGAIGFFVYRGILLPRSFNPTWWGGSVTSNFATVFVVHLRYLSVQLIPVGLLADYTPDAIELATTFLDGRVRAALAVVLGSILLAYLLRRRSPLAVVGILGYWIVLLPVSHVIPHHELAAEHHLYLPSVVICLAAGYGVEATVRWRRWAPGAVVAAVLVPCTALTIARNEVWANEELLWSDTVAKAPWCARAQLNLATIYLEQRRLGEAEVLLRRSLRVVDFPKTHAYLGNLYTIREQYEEADRIFRRGLEMWPKDRYILRFHGLNLRFMGREEEAREVLRKGSEYHPLDPDMHFLMAGSWIMSDEPEKALEEYLEVLRIRPVDEDSRMAAVVLAKSLGKVELAESLESR